MASLFDSLKAEWSELSDSADRAASAVYLDPRTAPTRSRMGVHEGAVGRARLHVGGIVARLDQGAELRP
jgi:hypothetical protein